MIDETVWRQYLSSFYWAMITSTTVGYGDISPVSDNEKAFATVVMIFAAMLYAAIFGNVSVLVQNLDRKSRSYLENREAVRQFSQVSGLPDKMAARLQAYTREVFMVNNGFSDVHHMINSLPSVM